MPKTNLTAAFVREATCPAGKLIQELNLKGTWAGGPVADLTAILEKIDGALIGGAIGFAVNGMLAR